MKGAIKVRNETRRPLCRAQGRVQGGFKPGPGLGAHTPSGFSDFGAALSA